MCCFFTEVQLAYTSHPLELKSVAFSMTLARGSTITCVTHYTSQSQVGKEEQHVCSSYGGFIVLKVGFTQILKQMMFPFNQCSVRWEKVV